MKFPMCVLVIVKSGNWTIIVGSEAESFVVLTSPPPETVTELVNREGAVTATLTINVITGKAKFPANASLRVHETVASVHDHPGPVIVVAINPFGRVSVTVTAADVEVFPMLVAVSV